MYAITHRAKYTMIFLFYLSVNWLYSQNQTVYIFSDDSLKRAKYTTEFCHPYEGELMHPGVMWPVDLKISLPDGKYIVVSMERKDSLKKTINDYVIIKGQYKDSLRHGRFEYYNRFRVGSNKYENRLTGITTYKNGLLDGYIVDKKVGRGAFKTFEGAYKEGQRHGFFLTYKITENTTTLSMIELFVEDTLKYCIRYTNCGEMLPLEIDNPPCGGKFIPYPNGMPIRKPWPNNQERGKNEEG